MSEMCFQLLNAVLFKNGPSRGGGLALEERQE
jgi:hypothetical protein